LQGKISVAGNFMSIQMIWTGSYGTTGFSQELALFLTNSPDHELKGPMVFWNDNTLGRSATGRPGADQLHHRVV